MKTFEALFLSTSGAEFTMQIFAWSYNDAYDRAETLAREEFLHAEVANVVEL